MPRWLKITLSIIAVAVFSYLCYIGYGFYLLLKFAN